MELNSFLEGHRIICVDRQFVSDASSSFWSLCVEYDDSSSPAYKLPSAKKNRIDYKEVLSEEEFSTFAKLREWRKEKCTALGVPIYTVFTNEHLAEISKLPELTKVSFSSINGIGEEKVGKFFEDVKKCLNQ